MMMTFNDGHDVWGKFPLDLNQAVRWYTSLCVVGRAAAEHYMVCASWHR